MFSKWAASHYRRDKARIILDLGCGRGRDSRVLAAAGFKVIGADLAMSCLKPGARKTRGKRGIPVVQADSRSLPFTVCSFDCVYCFGLLHEFLGSNAGKGVRRTMSEVSRLLRPDGLLALAVLAGDPRKGLPHVRLFTEAMLDADTKGFTCLAKRKCDDIGCTGRSGYRIWRGLYRKRLE